jgi:PIN domain nuclease of toxin-antitoxin system
VSTVLLDTHVVHWWSAEPARISSAASRAITEADELAVSDVSWFELAWLARHERISVTVAIDSWLRGLATQLRTVPISPAIAAAAVSLPSTFPADPSDRLIYSTATENGWRLITKDRKLRRYTHPHPVTLW